MREWANNPSYQRAIQQLSRMGPDQMAVINTAMVDGRFADAEMRKRLAAMVRASGNEYREKRLKQSGKGLGLMREGWQDHKSQVPLANAISAAGVGVSGYMGHQQDKIASKQAEQDNALARKYRSGLAGLYR